MIKLSQVKANPNNPRLIKDDKFNKLVNSIREFPKMMTLRPMVVNNEWVVLGGNMRLKALIELGYKQIPDEWVKQASELTEDEARRFIIADNVGFGENDWDMLEDEWNVEDLEAWGVDLPIGWGEGSDPFEDEGITAKNQYGVIVTCETAIEQEEIFNDLSGKGYKCKVVVV